MDISTFIADPLVILPLVVIFYIFLFILKTTTFKGKMGNKLIQVNTRIYLDNHCYHILNKVTLPTAAGNILIDHIIVSIYGIFVFSTVNLEGTISGAIDEESWSRKVGRRSYEFSNPVPENAQQTKTLAKILDLPAEQLFSLVVFVGESQFKAPMPANVTQGKGFIEFIQNKSSPVLNEVQVTQCLETLDKKRIADSLY